MAQTWGELLSEMRSELNEPIAAFYTDLEIMNIYNRVELQFARFSKVITETVAIAFEAGFQTAILPTTFLGIRHLSLVQSDDTQRFLFRGGARAVSTTSRLSVDLSYDVSGLLITMSSAQTDTESLTVGIWKKPVPFADPEALGVFSTMDESDTGYVMQGALYYLYKKRKDFQDASVAKQDYERGREESRRFNNDRFGKRQINIEH